MACKLLPNGRAHSFFPRMTLPIPAPRADGFTTSTEVPLYWREDGPPDAPAVVLLHGGPGAHHEYLYPQMLALASSHRVITYDQRGGGRSRTDDPRPVTWRTQVADLAAVLREFHLGASPLVGYSWGALLAMLYAIEAGADVTLPSISRLALISPAPITHGWRRQFETELASRQQSPTILGLRAELAASGLRETDLTAYRQRSFELSVAGYFADPRRAESLTPFRVTARVQQSVWDSLGDFDLREPLRAVRLPVLVVHGRNDPIPLDSAVAVADALSGELVVLDDCGHVPYVERPSALFDATQRFLI
jgi:proline iminopeptidase